MRPTSGDLTSVEFDAGWVLAREESKGDVLGFYHTHPSGMPLPSKRDDRTMRAWAGSFGKPLLCLIEADKAVRAYLYQGDDSDGVLVTACEAMPRGIVIVYDGGDDTDGK